MFNNFPKKTGVYYIKDNIEQLELRIHFRHINSLLKLPKFDYNKTVNGENELTIENDTKIEIKWQEKLFSVAERELYKDAKNCLTETQKKYHEWLLEQLTEPDDSTNAGKQHRKVGKRKRKKRKKQQQQPQQHLTTESKPEIETKKLYEIYTYVNEDHFQPDKKEPEIKSKSQCLESGNERIQEMYIYAALDIDTQLVHLRWFPQQHMLHIYPDFNSFSHNAYFIEIDKDYRHLYAYAVENISPSRSKIPSPNDLGLYLQLPICRPNWRIEQQALAATAFEMPPKRTKRISMLFEIREAYNFQYDKVHVRYYVELPVNTIHEEGVLVASTHTSAMSETGIHHFGFNWQLTLLCEEDYNAADLLHIYFEVISIDAWERERTEGYAHLAVRLLNATGLHKHRLQCLRPTSTTIWNSLERFFIGGRRKFDFKKFFGQKQKFHGSDIDECENDGNNIEFHSRYGCRMESTGIVQLNCRTFTQQNCELLNPCTNRRSGMTLDDIMMAYRMARKRLESLTL